MTVEGIEAKVRRLLQDIHVPYRWRSEDVVSYITDAVRSLNSERPETRYVNGILVDRVMLPENPSDEIAINDRYEEAIVYYVAHKCYLDDSTDTVNAQLAESYLSKFKMKAQF